MEDEIHFICRRNFRNAKFYSISETFDEFTHLSDTEKCVQ